MIKIIKSGWLIQQREAFKRMIKHKEIKLGIMKTAEKTNYGFKSQPISQKNPFLKFAKRNELDNSRNFIVEWQIDENNEAEVFGEKVY
jgi:hypothetical protein